MDQLAVADNIIHTQIEQYFALRAAFAGATGADGRQF